ncbi:hypothetical protein [Coleofasciculus chthonoplastes]|uniref:hypothetical protein n=1 Tax=Coleofasciculus chthonoplastes TaxID=64178 RepID=UPI003300C952
MSGSLFYWLLVVRNPTAIGSGDTELPTPDRYPLLPRRFKSLLHQLYGYKEKPKTEKLLMKTADPPLLQQKSQKMWE